jgi:hypothetical protein
VSTAGSAKATIAPDLDVTLAERAFVLDRDHRHELTADPRDRHRIRSFADRPLANLRERGQVDENQLAGLDAGNGEIADRQHGDTGRIAAGVERRDLLWPAWIADVDQPEPAADCVGIHEVFAVACGRHDLGAGRTGDAERRHRPERPDPEPIVITMAAVRERHGGQNARRRGKRTQLLHHRILRPSVNESGCRVAAVTEPGGLSAPAAEEVCRRRNENDNSRHPRHETLPRVACPKAR